MKMPARWIGHADIPDNCTRLDVSLPHDLLKSYRIRLKCFLHFVGICLCSHIIFPFDRRSFLISCREGSSFRRAFFNSGWLAMPHPQGSHICHIVKIYNKYIIEASVGQRWPWMIHPNVFVFGWKYTDSQEPRTSTITHSDWCFGHQNIGTRWFFLDQTTAFKLNHSYGFTIRKFYHSPFDWCGRYIDEPSPTTNAWHTDRKQGK